MTCGMTRRIDPVKIVLLQKGLKIRGDFDYFFNTRPKSLHFKTMCLNLKTFARDTRISV